MEFLPRSLAFGVAIRQLLTRIKRSRLACESSKLDKVEEQALADENYTGDVFAPEY